MALLELAEEQVSTVSFIVESVDNDAGIQQVGSHLAVAEFM